MRIGELDLQAGSFLDPFVVEHLAAWFPDQASSQARRKSAERADERVARRPCRVIIAKPDQHVNLYQGGDRRALASSDDQVSVNCSMLRLESDLAHGGAGRFGRSVVMHQPGQGR